jgi:hypothetical protein
MSKPDPLAVTGYSEAMEAKAAVARQLLRRAMDALAGVASADLYESMASIGEASMAASASLSMLGSALQSAEGALAYEAKPPEPLTAQ